MTDADLERVLGISAEEFRRRGGIIGEPASIPLMAPSAPSKSVASEIAEEAFTAAIIGLAQGLGWKVAHFRKARTKHGWRTAVSGDGKGWPDLALVRRRLVVAELKVGKNTTSPEQDAWLAAFRDAGIEAYIWRPKDIDEIRKVLT